VHDQQIRVTAYLRAYTPTSEPQNEVLARLNRLAETDRIDDWEARFVPRSVRRERETEASRLYDRITDWADRAGVDVKRPFEVRQYYNRFSDEVVDELVVPIVCLTTVRDGDVVAVVPCEDGDTCVSVFDYLDALERGVEPSAAVAGETAQATVPD
jgi:hypothetical protein